MEIFFIVLRHASPTMNQNPPSSMDWHSPVLSLILDALLPPPSPSVTLEGIRHLNLNGRLVCACGQLCLWLFDSCCNFDCCQHQWPSPDVIVRIECVMVHVFIFRFIIFFLELEPINKSICHFITFADITWDIIPYHEQYCITCILVFLGCAPSISAYGWAKHGRQNGTFCNWYDSSELLESNPSMLSRAWYHAKTSKCNTSSNKPCDDTMAWFCFETEVENQSHNHIFRTTVTLWCTRDNNIPATMIWLPLLDKSSLHQPRGLKATKGSNTTTSKMHRIISLGIPSTLVITNSATADRYRRVSPTPQKFQFLQ